MNFVFRAGEDGIAVSLVTALPFQQMGRTLPGSGLFHLAQENLYGFVTLAWIVCPQPRRDLVPSPPRKINSAQTIQEAPTQLSVVILVQVFE